MAGYSETPLVRKLGVRPNERIVALNAPTNYAGLLGRLPDGARIAGRIRRDAQFIHLFVSHRTELDKQLPELRRILHDNGMLWVSWPKKSSGVASDVTEDVIRALALPLGFVDTKVCAVDETWSGLRLVIRRINRTRK